MSTRTDFEKELFKLEAMTILERARNTVAVSTKLVGDLESLKSKYTAVDEVARINKSIKNAVESAKTMTALLPGLEMIEGEDFA